MILTGVNGFLGWMPVWVLNVFLTDFKSNRFLAWMPVWVSGSLYFFAIHHVGVTSMVVRKLQGS